MLHADRAALGKAYAPYLLGLLLESPAWVHRRTESLEFLDEASVRRRVSSDFRVVDCELGREYAELCQQQPPALPELLVPVGLLAKKALLAFDLRDGHNGSLSLLTQAETTLYSVEVVMEMARQLNRNAEPLRDKVTKIIDLRPREATAQLAGWTTDIRDPEVIMTANALWENALFRYVIHTLSEKFIALTVWPTSAVADRGIVKYAHVTSLPWHRFVLLRRLGWQPSQVTLALPGVHLSSSYHVEARSPENLDIVNAGIWKRDPQPDGRLSRARRVQGDSEGSGALAHLFIHSPGLTDQGAYELRIAFAGQRRGLVRSAAVATLFAAFTLVSLCFFGKHLPDHPNTAAASLLLILPGLAAAWISRPNEHALASRLYLGLRIVVLAAAACTFLVAAAVVVEPSAGALPWFLGTVASASVVCFLITLTTYLSNSRGIT